MPKVAGPAMSSCRTSAKGMVRVRFACNFIVYLTNVAISPAVCAYVHFVIIAAPLMKIKTYLSALRPWSLSASLVPTLLGAAIAYRTIGFQEFNFLTFLFTIFTVVTVHCAGNVVNTYFDFVKGIDNRKSDDRTLVDHILSKDEVCCG